MEEGKEGERERERERGRGEQAIKIRPETSLDAHFKVAEVGTHRYRDRRAFK